MKKIYVIFTPCVLRLIITYTSTTSGTRDLRTPVATPLQPP
jgi:hypothetical protein